MGKIFKDIDRKLFRSKKEIKGKRYQQMKAGESDIYFHASSVTVSWWHWHHDPSPFLVFMNGITMSFFRGGGGSILNLATTRENSTRNHCKTTILSNQFLHNRFAVYLSCFFYLRTIEIVKTFSNFTFISNWFIFRKDTEKKERKKKRKKKKYNYD